MKFQDLNLNPNILRAIDEQGYTTPTPIQQQSIPILLEGKDLLGCAQTGTGKTAAFGIPILQNLYGDGEYRKGKRKIRALVVTPTRELAIQIGDSFTTYGKHLGLKNTVIFGGVKQGSQTNTLRQGVDILVATPGRLLDLMQQGFISLRDVEYFVLDEADQMLDMGFIHDIKKLLAKLPEKRQSLFFSATMAPAIVELSQKILGKNVARVTIEPEQTTSERVDQCLYYVTKSNKIGLLIHLMEENPVDRVLVFSRTKHGADKVVRKLAKAGITAGAIHGNKSQNARQKALGAFKDRKLRVLIATDIAARGIDIAELSLVINYDLPNVPESYVHRIGRTGRANATGSAISFCDLEERPYLKDIQKLTGQKIPVIDQHPFIDDRVLGVDDLKTQKKQERNSNNRGSSGGSRKRGNRNFNSKSSSSDKPKGQGGGGRSRSGSNKKRGSGGPKSDRESGNSGNNGNNTWKRR